MASDNPYRSIFRPALFERRVAIVTGAGSGLGRCTAHHTPQQERRTEAFEGFHLARKPKVLE